MRPVYRLGQLLVLAGLVIFAGVFAISIADREDTDPRATALREYRRDAGETDPADARDQRRGRWAGGSFALVLGGALAMHAGRRSRTSALAVTTSD